MFQLVDAPLQFPGKSARLGETVGPMVDLGCELPLGGWVYLSRQETWEAARLFGFVEPEVVRELRDDNALLVDEIKRLTEALAAAEATHVKVVRLDEVTATSSGAQAAATYSVKA